MATNPGSLPARQRRIVDEMKGRLVAALGDRLVALLRHGPSTWGDGVEGELNLLVVLADDELATLAQLAAPLAYWRGHGLPTPRLSTEAQLATARDVFPLEIADLAVHAEVLVGRNPALALTVDDAHVRAQCERELVEKLMRLREACAEDPRPRALRRLLVASFPDFCLILRGALRLYGVAAPDRGVDAAVAFARAAAIDERPFVEVDALRRDAHGDVDARTLFARYYAALSRAGEIVNELEVAPSGRGPSRQQGRSE